MTASVRRRSLQVVVTSTASDAHTWNLIFLQLLLEELGHTVTNLGCCVPGEEIVAHCEENPPDLIVVSTVNGHGYHDGMRTIEVLRKAPVIQATPVIIGGKLGITGKSDEDRARALVEAGFDAVFEEGAATGSLQSYLNALPEGERV